MGQQKKRLPWWCVAAAVVLVIVALVVGFIETEGRQGTLIGRGASIDVGMSRADVLRILGPAEGASSPDSLMWLDDYCGFRVHFDSRAEVSRRDFVFDGPVHWHSPAWSFWDRTVWHLRLWADKAWMRLHGLHR